jgi:hypothetical protein
MVDQTCNKTGNIPQMLYKGETVKYYIKKQMHVVTPIYDFSHNFSQFPYAQLTWSIKAFQCSTSFHSENKVTLCKYLQ